MTISYPLAIPTSVSFTSLVIYPEKITGISVSPFNLNRTVYEHSGERWRAEFSLPQMKDPEARDWIGWLASLNGEVGTFLLGDPGMSTPLGNAGGTPLVNGSSQSGKVLATKGWAPSTSNIMRRGDQISISNRLYVVTANANSDAGGLASLDIWPSIRQTAPADGTTITVSSPKGTFALNGPQSWRTDPARIYSISISAVEPL